MKRDGYDAPSDVLLYESELKEKYLEQIKGAYPKLQDYRAEWLNYNLYFQLPSQFPYESVANVTSASFDNVVPYAYKSVILKGSSKYRDIDTGEFLETFEDGRSLELVSVKMPVLTTTNEDGTKTNILTVNEDVELRGIGDVRDELDLLTGELTQQIGEVVLNGSENWTKDSNGNLWRFICRDVLNNSNYNEICDKLPTGKSYWAIDETGLYIGGNHRPVIVFNSGDDRYNYSLTQFKEWLSQNPVTVQYKLEVPTIKTVDLTCINEHGESEALRPLEGTMHVSTSSQTLQPLLDMTVPVEATTQNLMSFANIEEEEK